MYSVIVQCNYLVAVEGSMTTYSRIVKDRRYMTLSPRCYQQNKQLFFFLLVETALSIFLVYLFFKAARAGIVGLWSGRPTGPNDNRSPFLL